MLGEPQIRISTASEFAPDIDVSAGKIEVVLISATVFDEIQFESFAFIAVSFMKLHDEFIVPYWFSLNNQKSSKLPYLSPATIYPPSLVY
ncbi:MAG: hypothetical protein A2Y62_08060 [Candidatus Fischerbacteria bacterium RBG_13_37_8]|uniref:Uncharacterized protein n=1 Tax=Candidatus Fischerbacteria bacterium RBG_13_37_8 TaxID=1817863 RepID=A0A1F5V5A0_9BACT|nr:MAG: hypothetical protein A2Y62_08060 [Candidatus Fischerbacteria bacterium RBG_13_37_8]